MRENERGERRRGGGEHKGAGVESEDGGGEVRGFGEGGVGERENGSEGAVARRDRERVGEARPNEYRSLRPEPRRRRGDVEKPPRSPACLIGDAGAEEISRLTTTASTVILRVEYAISKFPNYGPSFRAQSRNLPEVGCRYLWRLLDFARSDLPWNFEIASEPKE